MRPLLCCALVAAAAGCGPRAAATDAGEDAGPRPGRDAGPDAGPADGGAGAGPDAGADAGSVGGADAGPDAGVDRDLDGLDDALEGALASVYLPTLAVHPQDGCPLGGLLYRARPHPADPALVLILYVYLFESDCGLGGHVGDDEGFAVTVDPTKAPPQGLMALKAISHQATLCERTSTCGSCSGLDPCDTPDGGGAPVVYFSKDKHGSYAQKSTCDVLSCLDVCAAGARTGVPLVNVGEPAAHLVEDLTDGGFITTANGWTEAALFHFDPWAPMRAFGGAGVVADDLTDHAFTPPACR